jgi:Sel1 repeat
MFSLDYLRGKGRLVRAFWIYCVLIPVMMTLALFCLAYATNEFMPWLYKPVHFIEIALILIVLAFGNIAVWQCAWNTHRWIWSWVIIFMFFGNYFNIFIHHALFTTENIILLFYAWMNVLLILAALAGLFSTTRLSLICYRKMVPVIIIIMTILSIANEINSRTFTVIAELKNGIYVEKYRLNTTSSMHDEMSIEQQLHSMENAAFSGDIGAAYRLAIAYEFLPDFKDPTKAFQWMQFAANHGYHGAKNDLGVFYETGVGIDKDPATALRLYKEAYAEGDFNGAYNIGLMYETGKVVPRDYKIAAIYYQKNIDQSAEFKELNCAMNDLGALYATGKGVDQDDKKALALFASAAMKNIHITLPRDHQIKLHHKLTDFPAAFAKYRLSESKGKSIAELNLSPEMLFAVRTIADKYYQSCRT